MARVVGIDGCKGGWVAVVRDLETGVLGCAVVADFKSVLLFAGDAATIGVDMPIAFLDEATPGGRACDQAARTLLGGARASSVFSPPTRGALSAETYSQALSVNRSSSDAELGLSRQSFALFPKMREVDDQMTPSTQERIREVHPELSFLAMNGGQCVSNTKRTTEGIRERVGLLRYQGWKVDDELLTRWPRGIVAPDDILDAHAACWSAQRIALGTAMRIPMSPPTDAKGLHMEMWY